MIHQADKGGSIVVLDSGFYYQLNLLMLSDSNTYQKLDRDPTIGFQQELQNLLTDGVSLSVISEQIANRMFVTFPTTAIFHSFPKVHKEVFPPPMRPIVAGIGSMNELLGA